MTLHRQLLWHRFFQAAVYVKALDGILEIGAGTLLLIAKPAMIQNLVRILTHSELIEDPHDFVANLFVHLSHRFSIHVQFFAAAYLLAHGIIKLGLAVGLLRGVLWVYPVALLFLATFIFYQGDRIAHTHSITLGLLTAFDIAVLILIWHEWRQTRLETRL